MRQKVDHYSYTVQNFEALLLRARRTLAQREGLLPDRAHSLTPSPEFIHSKLRSSTINEVPSKGKRVQLLNDFNPLLPLKRVVGKQCRLKSDAA